MRVECGTLSTDFDLEESKIHKVQSLEEKAVERKHEVVMEDAEEEMASLKNGARCDNSEGGSLYANSYEDNMDLEASEERPGFYFDRQVELVRAFDSLDDQLSKRRQALALLVDIQGAAHVYETAISSLKFEINEYCEAKERLAERITDEAKAFDASENV